MKHRTIITGFAVVLLIMSLIGGFSAFLRHYILGTPFKVYEHENRIQNLESYHKTIDTYTILRENRLYDE